MPLSTGGFITPGETPQGVPIGLDLGVNQSVTLSNGRSACYRVPNGRETTFLKRLARQVSRKTKGSNRRGRAQQRLANRQRYHANRVKDDAHKLSTHLAKTHSEISIEDLKLRNMTASAKGTAEEPGSNVRAKAGLNRSLLVNAHGRFAVLLAYKCQRSGVKLHFKNPAYSSQECAECHHIASENRPSQAVFRCVKCGHEDNADRNAARVILGRSPTGGRSVAARGGKHKTIRKDCSPNEARTQLRDQQLSLVGSTGIPAL